MNIKKNAIPVGLFWLAAVATSFAVNYLGASGERQRLALFTARSYFKQIIVTRDWNSRHGGVYVPVTGETTPNPYLDVPDRDLSLEGGRMLTKINPAFMTRLISEISRESAGIQFHITSLNPISPANKAGELERVYLHRFAQGLMEGGEVIRKGDASYYFYMAPLRTEAACLQCHAGQGYREGDIRGGISVTFPYESEIPLKTMLLSHGGIALIGLFGIALVTRKLEASYATIQRQAVMDALTGIPNRRSFSEHIVREFERGRRHREPLSVVMGDIDCFKAFNDTYGHSAGDACLQRVAQAVKASLSRPGDFCARFGGEEFIVILPSTKGSGAMEVGERIRRAVESLGIENRRCSSGAGVVTMSIGISTMVDGSIDAYEELVRQADQALYCAKREGKNRVCRYGRENAEAR